MSALVARARGWIGTPYQHQCSLRGVGCDCLGLLVGLWRDQGGDVPEIPPYSRDWSEASGTETLWQALQARLTRADEIAPGQIILFRMREGAVAKHLGLLAKTGMQASFIHAMSGHGVIESHFTQAWARRVVARFEWPET